MGRSKENFLKYYINAKQQIPVPYGRMLHIPPTNLLLLAAKQEPHKRVYLLTKNIGRIFWKKFRRMDQQAEKKDRKSNRSGPKNKRGDSIMESNDSSEIPDRAETLDIPGFPSGTVKRT